MIRLAKSAQAPVPTPRRYFTGRRTQAPPPLLPKYLSRKKCKFVKPIFVGMGPADDGTEAREEGHHGFKPLGTSTGCIREISIQWVLPNSQGM